MRRWVVVGKVDTTAIDRSPFIVFDSQCNHGKQQVDKADTRLICRVCCSAIYLVIPRIILHVGTFDFGPKTWSLSSSSSPSPISLWPHSSLGKNCFTSIKHAMVVCNASVLCICPNQIGVNPDAAIFLAFFARYISMARSRSVSNCCRAAMLMFWSFRLLDALVCSIRSSSLVACRVFASSVYVHDQWLVCCFA